VAIVPRPRPGGTPTSCAGPSAAHRSSDELHLAALDHDDHDQRPLDDRLDYLAVSTATGEEAGGLRLAFRQLRLSPQRLASERTEDGHVTVL